MTAAAAGVAVFIAIGVVITAAIEWLPTRGLWVQSWHHLPAMPLVPGMGIGIAPLMRRVLLPPLIVWLVRRQLIASQGAATF